MPAVCSTAAQVKSSRAIEAPPEEAPKQKVAAPKVPEAGTGSLKSAVDLAAARVKKEVKGSMPTRTYAEKSARKGEKRIAEIEKMAYGEMSEAVQDEFG